MAKTSKDTSKPVKSVKKPRSKAQQEHTAELRGKKFGTDQDATEAGRKGGKKSGEIRRGYRTAKETLLWLDSLPLSPGDKDALMEMGVVDFDGITKLDIPTIRAHFMARNGNLSAAVYCHDLVEGRISEKHEVEVKSKFETMSKEELKKFFKENLELLDIYDDE